jgi:peptidoglycan/xylan/chitin deacetylase (PgdA/CDA1 family)
MGKKREIGACLNLRPRSGFFIISLDLELGWGVLDSKNYLKGYKKNLLGVRSAVPSILDLFEKYKIHATWAAVGCLFFESRDQLLHAFPAKRPNYQDRAFSAYANMINVGADEKEDPFHFAPSLIRLIRSYPAQEIGSHTFSHYLCLEEGQDGETFKEDLTAALKIAKKHHLNTESIVFPRHQSNKEYIPICAELGIKAYRGNEPAWIYRPKNSKSNQSAFRRLLRFLDSYLSITGYNCYPIHQIEGHYPHNTPPYNIPSSRFLRPYSKGLKSFEPLRLRRITDALTYAAKKGLIYHLWWHPHNFGVNLEKNLSFLEKILKHYAQLKKMYGMESQNMGELSRRLLEQHKNHSGKPNNKTYRANAKKLVYLQGL